MYGKKESTGKMSSSKMSSPKKKVMAMAKKGSGKKMSKTKSC